VNFFIGHDAKTVVKAIEGSIYNSKIMFFEKKDSENGNCCDF